MTQSNRIRMKFRSFQTLPKKPGSTFGFEWQVFEGLATLRYLRTLIFGIFPPSRGVCDLWKAAGLMSVLDLQAQFHGFTVSQFQHHLIGGAEQCQRRGTVISLLP